MPRWHAARPGADGGAVVGSNRDYVELATRHAKLTGDYRALLSRHRHLMAAADRLLMLTTDANLWDGDEADTEIMATFLEWMPDIVRHEQARQVRAMASQHDNEGIKNILNGLANDLEPFFVSNDSANVPSWFRKGDGRLVPWRVAREPSEEEVRAAQQAA
jgi:hypothetical protein